MHALSCTTVSNRCNPVSGYFIYLYSWSFEVWAPITLNLMQANHKRLRIPPVFFFLSAIILACAIITYMIPSGQYEKIIVKHGELEQTHILPDSYQKLPKHYSWKAVIRGVKEEGMATPTSLIGILFAVPKGL